MARTPIFAMAAALTPDQAKDALLEAITKISQDQWSTNWHKNLEYILWDQMLAGYYPLLVAYCTRAGGWWIKPGLLHPLRFVPMQTWLEVYEEYLQS